MFDLAELGPAQPQRVSFYISFNSNIDFDLILGSLLIFWGPKGLFLGWGRVQRLFWGLVIKTKNFCY